MLEHASPMFSYFFCRWMLVFQTAGLVGEFRRL